VTVCCATKANIKFWIHSDFIVNVINMKYPIDIHYNFETFDLSNILCSVQKINYRKLIIVFGITRVALPEN
jgi:hypothetical protein